MKSGKSLLCDLTLGVLVFAGANSAQAGFHLWNIREIYSNSSGTLQFIELFDPSSGGQQFVNGTSISVQNVGNTITHTFNISSNMPSDSLNHALLFGTAGLQAAGGPKPDFIVPDSFLFTAGGSISFFAASGPYTAIPTDGVNSRTWGGGNAPNTPQNFAGQIGSVVPEPTTIALLGVSAVGVFFCRRRRA
jgi:serralysin